MRAFFFGYPRAALGGPMRFSIAGVLATGLFIITFMIQAFAIPSGSMENTLLVGDHVFVNRVQFAPKSSWLGALLPYRDVQRGDIVVFLSPQTPGLYVVKRVIGVPGDRIHLRTRVVYRNGRVEFSVPQQRSRVLTVGGRSTRFA